jgi:hypothetical protein
MPGTTVLLANMEIVPAGGALRAVISASRVEDPRAADAPTDLADPGPADHARFRVARANAMMPPQSNGKPRPPSPN